MSPPTRREFLRRTALATGAIGLNSLGACSADGAPADSRRYEFKHGVASSDSLPERVMLWTRITPDEDGPALLRCALALDEAMTQFVAVWDLQTDSSRDYTVKFDAGGLAPDTVYHYRFSAGAAQSPVRPHAHGAGRQCLPLRLAAVISAAATSTPIAASPSATTWPR